MRRFIVRFTWSLVAVLLGCILLNSRVTQHDLSAFSVGAQAYITMTAPPPDPYIMLLEIDFDTVYPIQLEFRQPIRDLLEAQRSALPPEYRFTISAYRDTPEWAKITLVPTRIVEAAWADVEAVDPFVLEVVARRRSVTVWDVFLVGSVAFAEVQPDIPASFIDFRDAPPPTDAYLFPWRAGESWWAIQNWHGGNALDFQPGVGARFGILAAQAGHLRELCSDSFQSYVQIRHGDGNSTYYLHLKLSLDVRRGLLDQSVERGQYLGDLINRSSFETACGRGYSRHVHFAVSDRALMIDGYALEAIAEVASCCENPPLYTSSNVRVDNAP